jgi:hypothetical protein
MGMYGAWRGGMKMRGEQRERKRKREGEKLKERGEG